MREIAPSRSFRDPDGFLYQSADRILRYVRSHAAEDVRAFLGSSLANGWIQRGTLVSSTILEDPLDIETPPGCEAMFSPGDLVVEHDPIPFRNYPYEWSPEMLRCAGALTLDFARNATRNGFVLKDATPYNVMFDGSRPIFLDLLSFRVRNPSESMWQPYAQFIRTFVLPMLAYRYFDMRPDEILLTHGDGIEPERFLALCPFYRRLLPPFLTVVTIPTWLARAGRNRTGGYRPRHAKDAEEATFLLESVFRRAERLLDRAAKRRRANSGVEYMESGHPYAASEMLSKERFVTAALERISPGAVLDIGCNTGHFSRIAARTGARVVAIDRDPAAIDSLWASAAESALPILPLVIDICRPPGACGWRNGECAAFLDRARGKFDCVLMLALIHHLLVSERVPLPAIVDFASELTTHWAVVEYIDPADSNFQQIVRGREELHRDLSSEAFESAVSRRFQIVDSCQVSPTRKAYLLKKQS